MPIREIIQLTGAFLDLAGVLVIAVGATMATVVFARGWWRTRRLIDVYPPYRQGVGRAILLGLEFLVGGDIIRTVAVSPTFASVGVLALIVLVRTFLSISLEVELAGRWPWQGRNPVTRPDIGSGPAR
ncbi:DUF1622 domain-containing protein [Micromonospora sp. DR5-3]|uniref:DUF1622 domain-containing protein n=1 Tax=unclassified Micromonospora TaxID=2617518 RepID=UPI0011DB50D8|nr:MULTISPECIES: DUF1622 domain-containing protein [unclassified Micromonospora]MCW3816916.1 DUF1622 domain-containing protein [Micromonospora sp. DR5-3]TYC23463.1 DUF1622 domain-containing protein [Micromonospora sp. MP36]